MDNIKTKQSATEAVYPTKDLIGTNNNNVREVFRNNTTAVEVIVKQVGNKSRNSIPVNRNANDKLNNLYLDVELLQNEVIEAKTQLEDTRKCFQTILYEFKQQLEAANQRDLRRQTKNVLLQLEKEKLKALLVSKTNLVMKLKKELLSMRRLLKFIIKGLQFTPEVETDCDYGKFEKDLKRSASLKNRNVLDLDYVTFDSLI